MCLFLLLAAGSGCAHLIDRNSIVGLAVTPPRVPEVPLLWRCTMGTRRTHAVVPRGEEMGAHESVRLRLASYAIVWTPRAASEGHFLPWIGRVVNDRVV